MRPLEIILPALLAAYFLWPILTRAKRPAYAAALPLLAVTLTPVHLLVEKYRWQMIPIYVIVAITALVAGISLFRPAHISPRGTITASTLGLIVLTFATALPILLPVPHVPQPSGPYPVGTTTFVLTDNARRELYSGIDEPRKYMLQVWYPAQPGPNDQRAPWMQDAGIVAPGIADYLKLPHFFLDHLTLVKTSSYLNATPLAEDGPYPLLLFSHGWNGFRAQNTYQMQELASYGYIVAAMEHTYGAVVTVFPDGQVAYNNPKALPKGAPEAEYDAAARKLVNQWSNDLSYALDYLTRLNANDPNGHFTGMLDLERVGVFGHSTGGGATIQFCGTDPRCKAGLTLDAFMTPVSESVLNSGLQQPFLFIFSEAFPTEKNTRLFEQLYSHLPPSDRVVTILGTSHYDLSDLPMLSPLAHQLGLKGPLNGKRAEQITIDYERAFFAATLKGQNTSLFDGPSRFYPEVRYDH